MTAKRAPLVGAGLVLGIGFGGFVDGIVLHQMLQWHNMLSNVVPPVDLIAMKYNMIWDGAFHALTWTACLVGLVLVFRAARIPGAAWSARLLFGMMIAGWGLFDLVEGLIDHQLLGLHHVHPGAHQAAWDLGFVAIGGVGFLLLGYAIARSDRAPRTLAHGPDPVQVVSKTVPNTTTRARRCTRARRSRIRAIAASATGSRGAGHSPPAFHGVQRGL